MRHTILNKYVPKRREFNPENPVDLQELRFFMVNGHWKTSCPFWEEDKWNDIPSMYLTKYAKHHLSLL